MRLLLICLALAACGTQRTGGEESIPRVLFTHEAEVTYCEYRDHEPEYGHRCKRQTTYRCPVDGASECFRTGDSFNPLEHCNTDCRETTDD